MKMRAASLLFLATSSLLWARLGETEKELVARFGDARMRTKHTIMGHGKISELGPSLHFKQDDWNIVSDLVDDRVVRENYRKAGDWSPEQIQTVLAANAQGATWTETTKGNGKLSRKWMRSDGGTAEWIKAAGFKVISPAYDRAKEIAESKAKAGAKRTPKI